MLLNKISLLDTYWQFVCSRQEIFFAKLSGSHIKSHDPILNKYKFTNVYRAADRVSQYLINNVIYNPAHSKKSEDVVTRILLFKIFNTINTWELLEKHFREHNQEITWQHFNQFYEQYIEILNNAKNDGITIFNSAYMQSGKRAYGFKYKHANHLILLKELLGVPNISTMLKVKTMKELITYLEQWPLIGPFLAYQFAIDLNYSEVFNFDENEYVLPGAGCIRGLAKIYNLNFSATKKLAPHLLRLMQINQKEEFSKRGLNFIDLFGREMKLIDVQNCCCEIDKYCRVAFPHITSFGKSKIKHNYAPSILGNINYMFPPKWDINGNIASYINSLKES